MYIKNIILTLLILAGITSAQFSKSLEISSYYDDNLFRSPQADSDLLTDLLIDLEYQPEISNFSFNYSGNIILYQDNSIRNFSLHSLGLDYSVPFGKDELNNFNMGVHYTTRINGDDYNYYNYDQFYLFSNLRMDIDWMFITAGYNFRYRDYSFLPDLTNNQHYVFLQLNKSFDTRTTVILETNLGQKSFAGHNTIISTTSSSSDGHGRGGRTGTINETTSMTNEDIPSLSQAVFLARITQSLHDKIGLYLQYRRQLSLTKKTSFVNANDYYQDEELFDDPFSYESKSYSTQLTWILPWTMKIQLRSTFESKNYVSEQAFISIDDSVGSGGARLDDRSNISINFSKLFYIDKAWIKSLRFNMHYNYIRSESNSYWYDYRNNVFGAGIQWNF